MTVGENGGVRPAGPSNADALPSDAPRTAARGAPRGDVALLDALRGDLTDAGYTVPAVEELLGPLASAALHRGEYTQPQGEPREQYENQTANTRHKPRKITLGQC